ncbi:MAG: uroporphyrinogen decarboxylase family protein, partial [Armatimonadota bacterium]
AVIIPKSSVEGRERVGIEFSALEHISMMKAKERMIQALSGKSQDPPPVVLHSWGDYKVELAGIHPKYQYYLGGPELAEIERSFYKRFEPDWMHLGSGADKNWWGQPRKVDGNRAFIQSSDGARWIEIQDNYILAEENQPTKTLNRRLRLESRAEIDDYFAARVYSENEILQCGRFDHVSILSGECGSEVLIAVNDGAPGCSIPDHSFEEAMIACTEKPDLVKHYIFKSCEQFLVDVRAAKACGADAYIFSEGFGGSLDQLSPEMHERLEMDAKKWFYSEVRKIGILPIGYWLGDVRRNMGLINQLDMAALMIEESKKGFVLDPLEIRLALKPDICLIGNVDSAMLLHGTCEQIRSEVFRQLCAAGYGAFVLANGSPLIIGTPVANVEAFVAAGRAGTQG